MKDIIDTNTIELTEEQAAAFRKVFGVDPVTRITYLVPNTPETKAILTVLVPAEEEKEEVVVHQPSANPTNEHYTFFHGKAALCLKANSFEGQAILFLEAVFPDQSVISRIDIYKRLRLLWTVASGNVRRGESMVYTLVCRGALIAI